MKLQQNSTTERARLVADLCMGAFFFAMRSCEYLTVSGERKTKRLRLENFQFFMNHKMIPLDSPRIGSADCVSITFVDQKNSQKQDTITMHASGDLILCPVRSWARVVQRVLSYKTTSHRSFVNTFYSHGKLQFVTGSNVLHALRAAARCVGEAKLGFKPNELGTHSIRSGAAMAMYLDDVPVYTIMLVGRWSSDAFLVYIRKQVEQFTHNVSSRMIRNQHFNHIPSRVPTVSNNDPRTRNNPHNAQTRRNMGQVSAHVIPTLPSFALYT